MAGQVVQVDIRSKAITQRWTVGAQAVSCIALQHQKRSRSMPASKVASHDRAATSSAVTPQAAQPAASAPATMAATANVARSTTNATSATTTPTAPQLPEPGRMLPTSTPARAPASANRGSTSAAAPAPPSVEAKVAPKAKPDASPSAISPPKMFTPAPNKARIRREPAASLAATTSKTGSAPASMDDLRSRLAQLQAAMERAPSPKQQPTSFPSPRRDSATNSTAPVASPPSQSQSKLPVEAAANTTPSTAPPKPTEPIRQPSSFAVSASEAMLRGTPSLTPHVPPPTVSGSTDRSAADTSQPTQANTSAARELLELERHKLERANIENRHAGANMPLDAGVQADFIRNVVQSTLDDFRFSLHRDVHNLHVELIRQFELQKARTLTGPVLSPLFATRLTQCVICTSTCRRNWKHHLNRYLFAKKLSQSSSCCGRKIASYGCNSNFRNQPVPRLTRVVVFRFHVYFCVLCLMPFLCIVRWMRVLVRN
ncbi:uncharacterized protein MONBRDRAFT_36327 [Monosiga brevicollis MX1]|uniref:Uncharacterized protein n=1 Tax=Monosiga brevicollis TaxID=81824 RepID=A9UUX9_MONBE|nr:uncharacterized protein MONBRDRAFT_36327 [Monosiga brevicollis MX1]EDQ90985.1 predicted protein [Monosiga brevicollis MX1]|eukprot:XP_001744282.1 hypothetical protein [Monosiga brevicollis MX1]